MKIKVLVIDDSAVVRQTMTDILSSDPEIEVVGTASDPIFAIRKIESDKPDVLTLDIEMPRMDGLTFLRRMNLTANPIPVVICSSKVEAGSDNAFKALEYGAAELILKPQIGTKQFLMESQIRICDAVKAAYCARNKINVRKTILREDSVKDALKFASSVAPKLDADVILEKGPAPLTLDTTEKVVVVGASTGGTEALKDFCSRIGVCKANSEVQIAYLEACLLIGLKLYTNGVLIVGLSEIEDIENNKVKPYENTEIREGDTIIQIDNKEIDSVNTLKEIVNKSNGKTLNLVLVRDGTVLTSNIVPVKVGSSEYKLGLWVRDAATGVGTITYYDAAGVYQLTDVIDRLMTTNKNNLKVLLLNIASTINPDIIVIGGGVMNARAKFLDEVIRDFRNEAHPFIKHTLIDVAKFEEPGIVGAALMAKQKYGL